MSFQFMGPNVFQDLRRPVEGSSDRLFKDFYNKTVCNASHVSKEVTGVTLGSNAGIINGNGHRSISIDQPGSPVDTSTPKKATPTRRRESSKNNVPFEMKRNEHIHSDNRRPNIDVCASQHTSPDKMKLMVVQNYMSRVGSNNPTLRAEEVARKSQIDLKMKLAKQYDTAGKARQCQNEIFEKAILDVVNESINTQNFPKTPVADTQARNARIKQNCIEQQRKIKMESILEHKNKLKAAIADCHSKYCQSYSTLQEMLVKYKGSQILPTKIISSVEEVRKLAPVVSAQIAKQKAGSLSQEDLKKATEIRAHINNVITMLSDFEQAEKAASALKKEQEDKAAQESQSLSMSNNTQAVQKVVDTSESGDETADWANCCDPKYLKNILLLKNKLEHTQTSLEPLLKDEKYEKYRFELHKNATIPVNAIARVSAKHMLDKYTKLRDLLSGNCGGKHPLGPLYVRNVLAKVFVKQGDVTVSSRPEAAFELASVLVNLWVEFPDFGELVQAHFLAICPYLGPVFWPKLEGQSEQDHLRQIGYIVSNGVVERQDSFLKRMKGIIRLYAALLITTTRRGQPNPLGMAEAWRWLSTICNLPPHPDISAVLILEFLEVVGYDLLRIYGVQAKKLLALICKEYYPKLEAASVNASKGPLSRLGTFLVKAMREGTIASPKDRLDKFW